MRSRSALALLALLAFSGCSNDSPDPDASPAAGGAPPSTATGEAAAGPMTGGHGGMPPETSMTGGAGGTGGANSGGTGGAGIGGASSGGTGGATAGGTGGAAGGGAGDGSFELVWEDPFDTVDLTRWQLMTHSWDGNLAQFTGENAAVSDGILHLSLTAANETSKPFRGVEMRSRETLTYGKIEASARFAQGSAVVSSLVLIYTPWPPDDWNELDIEFLGKDADRIQFNHMVNIPPADPATGHLQFPELVTLDFNPAAGFHTYAIEWVPGEARFYVDGALMHTATEEMARMVLPQNILLTIWASGSPDWAGPVDSSTAPTRAEYDWLRVYRHVGP